MSSNEAKKILGRHDPFASCNVQPKLDWHSALDAFLLPTSFAVSSSTKSLRRCHLYLILPLFSTWFFLSVHHLKRDSRAATDTRPVYSRPRRQCRRRATEESCPDNLTIPPSLSEQSVVLSHVCATRYILRTKCVASLTRLRTCHRGAWFCPCKSYAWRISFYHIPLMVYNMTWSLDLLPSFKTVLHR